MSVVLWPENLAFIPGTSPPTCSLCHFKIEQHWDYGKPYSLCGTSVHLFCVFLATYLEQNGRDREGIFGFLLKDIWKIIRIHKYKVCYYCGGKGATVQCCNKKCPIMFHAPCGIKNGTSHEFYGSFKSFCHEHRKLQKIEQRILIEAKKTNTICIICQATLDPEQLCDVVWAPCCKKNGVFHKTCLQNLAWNAGYYFKCPLCCNMAYFQKEMKKFGVFIPKSDASWEEPGAFRDLYERYSRCDAKKCTNKRGRTYTKQGTLLEIVLCALCGSHGVHKKCAHLKLEVTQWVCEVCSRVSVTTPREADGIPHINRQLTAHSDCVSNVEDVCISPVPKRYLPNIVLDKTLSVPPYVNIEKSSLNLLKAHYNVIHGRNGMQIFTTVSSRLEAPKNAVGNEQRNLSEGACESLCIDNTQSPTLPGCSTWGSVETQTDNELPAEEPAAINSLPVPSNVLPVTNQIRKQRLKKPRSKLSHACLELGVTRRYLYPWKLHTTRSGRMYSYGTF